MTRAYTCMELGVCQALDCRTCHARRAFAAPAPSTDKPVDAPPQAVLPRQVNVMAGPLYRQGTGTVQRPGALDYKRVASRGGRC